MSRRHRTHDRHPDDLGPVHVTCPGGPAGLDDIGPGDRLGIDDNGCLTRTTQIDGTPIVIHYDEVPESDIEEIDGVRVTTALRTTIDLAAQLSTQQLHHLVDDFMDRGLFTAEEAFARLARPDMARRRGAHILRGLLEGRQAA